MAKKFSEKGDTGAFFEKIPNLKTTLGIEDKPPDRLVGRIYHRIRRLFSFFEKGPSPLKGRVEEMHSKIAGVKNRLKEIRESALAEGASAEEMQAFVDMILHPLIEEGKRLQEMRDLTDPFHQVKVLDLYQIWMDKSEFWIIAFRTHARGSFFRLVNEHIWKDLAAKVERDLKILQDYAEHAVQSLLVSEKDKMVLKNQIDQAVSAHIVSLASLKRLPKEITFKDLEAWNRKIDSQRLQHFEEGLSLIDSMIEQFKPHAAQEEYQHLLDVIEVINSIEEQTLRLKQKAKRTGVDSDEWQIIRDKAALLGREAHSISLDLRLSQPLVERLEDIDEMLASILTHASGTFSESET
ncbi:hypothetical protein [Estrella lausannensis]|uniref:Uncharacterized protein n=1 Tax=Estrella lausannensis TaxID=483423 RepID=A0A0H5E828_9BACT|nr:hypothetical protein [Estrella lausannensis]CRX39505.1 hypothetical protein ELAC_2185 [Estrella lausannensis]